MKGLLIKDLELMRKRANIYLFMVVMAIIMAVTLKNTLFILGYMTMVLSLFATTTISYDEFDNGYAFLFTLPISRKEYVLEKYMLAIVLGLISSAVSFILGFVLSLFGMEFSPILSLAVTPVAIMISLLMQAVTIPIQFKFGVEKSQTICRVITVVFLLGGIFGMQLLIKTGIDINQVISSMNGYILLAALIIIPLIAVAISYAISARIMEKKEF